MKGKELNIGDVFKITDHPRLSKDTLWRKETRHHARPVKKEGCLWKRCHPWRTLPLGKVNGCTAEVVERADSAPIRRVGDTLVLKGGDILLGDMFSFTV